MATTLNTLDRFLRVNSSGGSPGNGWSDINGGAAGTNWFVSGMSLKSAAEATAHQGLRCLRPASDLLSQNQAVIAHMFNPGNDAEVWLRVDPATGAGYMFRVVGTS